ncbi:MAG: chemotaxis protein CheW [Gammaproteobacteria bacterium]
MENTVLLIFDLYGAHFGLDAASVIETVSLPELAPVEEAPPWIVGMFSLRGPIIPVIDLHRRFGHPIKPYRVSDQIVVLKAEHQRVGLIVSEVLEIVEIPSDAIRPSPQLDTPNTGITHLSSGIAFVENELVTVLDISQLLKLSEPLDAESIPEPVEADHNLYTDTSPDTRSLLHSRAIALRKVPETNDKARISLAVVELSGEYFGIELTAVREFCSITRLTPIPCCPPHILGVFGLRGNLLTLVDPRYSLNLATDIEADKAVIVRSDEQLIGIAVYEVHDVVDLPDLDIKPPPSALRERYGASIIGTANRAGKTMTVLNLSALMQGNAWVVDENV